MRRRILCLALAAVMLTGITGCRGNDGGASSGTPGNISSDASGSGGSSTGTETSNYKIGIITGTVSQGDEQITQANRMKEKYGDMIVTATYPDNFATETETVISNAVAMASDPEVKAIVWCQAVAGTAAAIDKVRETRPDMIFIVGASGEEPSVIDTKADINLDIDTRGIGFMLPEQAAKQGAKTLIHYSFPRHMGISLFVERRENMRKACEEYGIEFVDVTTPDPTGDSGVTGAQQFILEDVARQVERYGKDTAFFCTNCSMQEPLIREVYETGAIYTLQCCPSPFHAIPVALNIDMADHAADVDYLIEQVKAKTAEMGMSGRVSTWKVPLSMLNIAGGVEYAIKILDGETNGIVDDAVLSQTLQDCAKEIWGSGITIAKYTENGVKVPHHYMLQSSFVDF